VGRAASWIAGGGGGGGGSMADSAGADGGTAALEDDDDAAVGLRSGRTDGGGGGLVKSALKSRYAMPGLAVKKSVRVDPHSHALGGAGSDPFADIGTPVATARSLSPRSSGSGHPLPEDAVVGQYAHVLLELVRKYEVDNISPVFHDFGAPYIDAGTLTVTHVTSSAVEGGDGGSVGSAAASTALGGGPVRQVYRFRISVTNECTDVLSVQVAPKRLPKAAFGFAVVESAKFVSKTLPPSGSTSSILAAALSKSAGPAAGGKRPSPSPSPSSSHHITVRGLTGEAEGDSTVVARPMAASRLSDGPASPAAVPLLKHKSSKWQKTGMETYFNAESQEITALDLAPGLSLVVEMTVVPPDDSDATQEVLGEVKISATSIMGEHQTVNVPVYARFEPMLSRPVAPAATRYDAQDEWREFHTTPAERRASLQGVTAAALAAAAAAAAGGSGGGVAAGGSVGSVGSGGGAPADAAAPRDAGSAASPPGAHASLASSTGPASPTRVAAPVIRRGDSFRDLASGR
jgi:hypothetical protein